MQAKMPMASGSGVTFAMLAIRPGAHGDCEIGAGDVDGGRPIEQVCRSDYSYTITPQSNELRHD